MRFVSLLPSTTEIVFDLGLAAQLYGVTIECNWPAQAKTGREVVVGTFTNPGMSPGEIDAIVKERVAKGLDLYDLDDAALARCRPDLILSQDLCRVCAVASGDVEAAVARLIDSINTIAVAAGVTDRGQEITKSLHQRLDLVRERVLGRVRPRVFVLEWIDPPFGAGHWVPDIITAAGGEPVVCRPGQRSVQTSWDEIAEAKPDVVIVAPCGYGLGEAAKQAALIRENLPNSAQVWAIDADAVMVRPGPRLIDGVEVIAAMLHGGEIDHNLIKKIGTAPKLG